jgi:hypothetical protein
LPNGEATPVISSPRIGGKLRKIFKTSRYSQKHIDDIDANESRFDRQMKENPRNPPNGSGT